MSWSNVAVIVQSHQRHPEPLARSGESDLAFRDVVVESRDAAGSVRTIELDRLSAEQIRLAVPFRRLGSRRNQTHMPGWYWSATMAAHVGYESRLELACLLLADRNPAVIEIYSQPFRLVATCPDGRRVRTVPDYLLVSADGSVRVVEVKPARQAVKQVVAARLAAMAEVLHRFGFGFQVFTEPDPVQLTNVRFLSGYRRSRMFRTAILDAVLASIRQRVLIPGRPFRLDRFVPRG
jgi:hypothetical protein